MAAPLAALYACGGGGTEARVAAGGSQPVATGSVAARPGASDAEGLDTSGFPAVAEGLWVLASVIGSGVARSMSLVEDDWGNVSGLGHWSEGTLNEMRQPAGGALTAWGRRLGDHVSLRIDFYEGPILARTMNFEGTLQGDQLAGTETSSGDQTGDAVTFSRTASNAQSSPLTDTWTWPQLAASGAGQSMTLTEDATGAVTGSGTWRTGLFNGVDGVLEGTLFVAGQRDGAAVNLRITYYQKGAIRQTTTFVGVVDGNWLRGTEDGQPTLVRRPVARLTPPLPPEVLAGGWEPRSGHAFGFLDKSSFTLIEDRAGSVTGTGSWATAGVFWAIGDTGDHGGSIAVIGEHLGADVRLEFTLYRGSVVDRTVAFVGTLSGGVLSGRANGEPVEFGRPVQPPW
jgi:hypothetical protein